jgi:hypothetical protein
MEQIYLGAALLLGQMVMQRAPDQTEIKTADNREKPSR